MSDLNVRRAINVILSQGLADLGLGVDQLRELQHAATVALREIQSGRRNPRTDPLPGDLFCAYPWGTSTSRYVECISIDDSLETVVEYCDPFKPVKKLRKTRLRYWKRWAGSDNVDVFQVPSHSDGFCRIAHTPYHLYNGHAEPTCRQRQVLANQGCEWIGRVRFCVWCRQSCDEPELLQAEVPQVVLDYLNDEERGEKQWEEEQFSHEDEDEGPEISLALRSWDLAQRLDQLIEDHEGDPRPVLYDWSDDLEEFSSHVRALPVLLKSADARIVQEHGSHLIRGLSSEQVARLSNNPCIAELMELQ